MTVLTPNNPLHPVPFDRAVSVTSSGMIRMRAGSYRPTARASFIAPLPTVGRHVAAVAAPGLVLGVAGATVTAIALMMGLGR